MTRHEKGNIILTAVQDITEIPFKRMISKCRDRELVYARHISATLLMKYAKYSQAETGLILGFRDHATSLHSKCAIGYAQFESYKTGQDTGLYSLYLQVENKVNKLLPNPESKIPSRLSA